jgi:hypothetical protein
MCLGAEHPMTGIIGRVDVEDPSLRPTLAMDLEELVHQQAVELTDLAGGEGVLEPAERRLAGQRIARRPVADRLEQRGVSQAIVIAAIGIPGDHSEEPLTEHLDETVLGLGGLAGTSTLAVWDVQPRR